eukprot:9501263-Pyramimonas_sp.AAC.1
MDGRHTRPSESAKRPAWYVRECQILPLAKKRFHLNPPHQDRIDTKFRLARGSRPETWSLLHNLEEPQALLISALTSQALNPKPKIILTISSGCACSYSFADVREPHQQPRPWHPERYYAHLGHRSPHHPSLS